MSGFKDVVKGFVNTLLGIGRNPDEDFIFFWDDEDVTETPSEQFNLSRSLKANRTEFTMTLSVLFIIVSLIFNKGYKIWSFDISILTRYSSLFLLLLSLYYLQTRYKDPLEMVNTEMNRLKDLDFSESGQFIYLKNTPESLENLEKFKVSMSKITTTLNDTSIDLMNSLFLVEEKFRTIQFSIENASSLLDTAGMSTGNYQEIKYYSNQISTGVDSFTSVFDESLNSNEDVISVIKSIGRQINMLALNAGIEASRAGELGIGFEVVSNNLRRLSQHAVTTTSNSKTIRTSINKDARAALETITQSMNLLVANIDRSYTSVNSINNELFTVKQGLVSIADDIDKVQHLMNVIGTELQHIKK